MNKINNPASAKFPGRGAGINPTGRFEAVSYSEDLDTGSDDEKTPLKTQYYKDASQSLITYNTSPDISFNASINPYRGCEHGCIYCYARATHEYFGLSAGLDFETKIFVKEQAPDILRRELARPSWKPQPIAISGITDPYQPIERRLNLTRQCLKVLAEFRNPVGIITKSYLVTRDIDILQELSRFQGIAAAVSITTLQPKLARLMEPRAAQPARRLEGIQKLAKSGIQVGVLVAPVVPGLNDHEIPAIIEAAREAGAQYAGYVMLRLPYGVQDLFNDWLNQHFPNQKKKILSRIRDIRGGKLNESKFHSRMRGKGQFGEFINTLFDISCRKASLSNKKPILNSAAFQRTQNRQPTLF